MKIFSRLCDDFGSSYLLESIEGPRKLAEFSFIGFDPKKMVSVKNGKTEIAEDCDRSVVETCDPLGTIGEAIRDYRIPHNRFRFVGGAVGYISYDAIRYWENLPNAPIDDLNLPDIEMGIYDDGIVFDHAEKKAYYYSSTQSRFEEIEECLRKPPSDKNRRLKIQ